MLLTFAIFDSVVIADVNIGTAVGRSIIMGGGGSYAGCIKKATT